IPVPVDRDALEAIADDTGGTFFEAADAGQIKDVYADIGRSVGYETKPSEITAAFTGIGLLLAVGAAAGSLFWMARLP
ncbi:MAG: VWA domain-containing protein, partial [Acidimicrobiales bacterium]